MTSSGTLKEKYDAVVVGSGPNGLGAAITLAREGLSVLILEANEIPGGGVRSAELTIPGFIHDLCSAIYPMAVASPFLRSLPLSSHGLTWIHPTIPLAHPLPGGGAVVLKNSVIETAQSLGLDALTYRHFMEPLVARADDLIKDLVGPFRFPKHPFLALRFGRKALLSAEGLAYRFFSTEATRSLWAGLASHAILPLDKPISSAIAMMLAIAAHAYGWPLVQGGSQNLTTAMLAYFYSLGGELRLGQRVLSLKDIPASRLVLFDLGPKQIADMKDLPLSPIYRRRLRRFRYGPGVFKVDWALSEPIPWTASACLEAGTVHVGGSMDEIADAERKVWSGSLPEKPFVLLAQPSLFDSTRAPSGRQIAWAYCHVPNGSGADQTAAIEAQIERFAPGFRDCILARHTMGPSDLEKHNANYIGGDIVGGVSDIGQVFTRPTFRLNPYRLAEKSYYIGSASTPPGGGVHGLSGYYAARSALKDLRGY